MYTRPAIENASLGTLVDTALRLGKKRKRNVYVAATRCWSGAVAVAPELMRDASPEETLQTIALEAEPFSGISAFDSRSAERPLPPTLAGDARYWVTQIAAGDLREIENAVRAAGGRLLGVGHPAVPVISQPAATEPWQSLQFWDGATLAARGNGEAIADMLTLASGLQSTRTRQELEAFFPPADAEQSPPLEWIGCGRPPELLETLPAAEELRPLDLTREDDLGRWAVAWARLQQAGSGGLPMITTPKKPMSKEASLAIAAVLGLAAMGVCGAHYWHLKSELAGHDATIAEAKKQADQLKADKDRLKTIEQKRDKLTSEAKTTRERAEQLRQQLTAAAKMSRESRSRWLSLVDTLVDVSEESSWVNEIRGDDGQVTLAGLALDDAAAHRFASAISKSLQVEGWKALPADTEIDPDTKLIRFQITLSAGEQVPPPAK